jgi:hypothetical protein
MCDKDNEDETHIIIRIQPFEYYSHLNPITKQKFLIICSPYLLEHIICTYTKPWKTEIFTHKKQQTNKIDKLTNKWVLWTTLNKAVSTDFDIAKEDPASHVYRTMNTLYILFSEFCIHGWLNNHWFVYFQIE